MSDTKTPRTDAEATLSCDSGLRSAYVVHVDFARELEREIARLTAERDEARRMYCMAQSHVDEEYGKTILPEEQAKERGWDCFKDSK